MYNVCYDISAVNPAMPDDMLIGLNEAAVTGLALVNQVILRYYNIPSIYQIAPRYYIPLGKERWKDIGQVLKDRWGDCKDFTAWRLAELWREGVTAARAESIVQRFNRSLLFHTYIRLPDGRTEDPARRLGMT